MKTYSAKHTEVQKDWVLFDAEGLILGRLASEIAMRLRGKDKPGFTPHVDCGSNVVVINADKVEMTGKKWDNEKFYWHTGYPGGIKERTMKQILEGNHPERVVMKAVERMMPKTKLGRKQLTGLRVYVGTEHGHEAQKPKKIDFAAQNPKNVKRS